jgi:hypothetical protein
MKSIKQKKSTRKPDFEDMEKIKPKKKMASNEQKVNLKSNKFWEEIYDDEEDNLEKYAKE